MAGVEPLQAQAVRGRPRAAPGRPRWRSRGPSGGARSSSRTRSRRSGGGRSRSLRSARARAAGARKMSSDGSDGLALGREPGLGVLRPVGPGRGGEVADDALVGDRSRTGPGRPGSSRAAATVFRSSRTSFFLPSAASCGPFGLQAERQFRGRNEKGEEPWRLLSLEFGSRTETWSRPSGGRPFIDASLFRCFRRLRHVDADELAAELAVAKRDPAVGKRKEGMVLADADVGARIPAGAALTHDDVAGERRSRRRTS